MIGGGEGEADEDGGDGVAGVPEDEAVGGAVAQGDEHHQDVAENKDGKEDLEKRVDGPGRDMEGKM